MYTVFAQEFALFGVAWIAGRRAAVHHAHLGPWVEVLELLRISTGECRGVCGFLHFSHPSSVGMSILNPAAFLWPPPPKTFAMALTS